jgi:beta-lactam-binding protein with PASTA domain
MVTLHEEGFEMGQVLRYYSPDEPAMVVLKQNPPPGAGVKPGRRVYLTINSGNAPRIEVPDLSFVSMREARSRLASNRLVLGLVFEDTLPAPFENTVTRQLPEAGDSVTVGTPIDIWISTGLGISFVEVPDITNMSAADAERMLLLTKLRLVVLEDPDIPLSRRDTIARQQPDPGTEVRAGSEIHAFANMAEMPFDPAMEDSIRAVFGREEQRD